MEKIDICVSNFFAQMALHFRLRILWMVSSICFGGSAITQNTVFEKITIEQGLSQGMIFDILQSRDGFLWVATKDGLNRYDGYNFKVFSNNPFDAFSMAQNSVTTLFEDSRGLIWVGLDSRGLDVFDPKTGRFHHFPLDKKGDVIVHGTEVRRIVELSDGSIWVLKVGTGLIRLVVPEDWKRGLPQESMLEKWVKPEFFKIDMDINAQPLPEAILDLSLLANGDLLATTNHHQFRIEPKSGTYYIVNPDMITTNTRWATQGDEAFGGDLWVGQGECIRRLRNGVIKTYLPHGPFCNLSLTKGRNGHVWLSLCSKLWDLAPGEDLDFSKPDLLLDCTITCLEQDKNGNLWLGTSGYGLRKINAVGKRFHTGGQGTSVRGIWRDPVGRYYGKDFSTIKSYDPLTGRFSARSAFIDKHTPLSEFCLSFDPDGTTWLLCWENGTSKLPMLRRYTPEGHLLKSYEFEADNLCDILLRKHDGSFWFSTGHCRLMRFDPKAERFEQFSFAHLFGEKSGSVRVTALAEDAEGLIWAGTQSGLVKCSPTAQGFDYQLFEANPAKLDGLNSNSIASILPTAHGQIWWHQCIESSNRPLPPHHPCKRSAEQRGLWHTFRQSSGRILVQYQSGFGQNHGIEEGSF
jgi:ligand-binding sensor domain-containing protein